MPEALQNVTFDITSWTLAWIGGGDADVCTKDGRKTRVYLAVKNIQVTPEGRVKLFTEYKSRSS